MVKKFCLLKNNSFVPPKQPNTVFKKIPANYAYTPFCFGQIQNSAHVQGTKTTALIIYCLSMGDERVYRVQQQEGLDSLRGSDTLIKRTGPRFAGCADKRPLKILWLIPTSGKGYGGGGRVLKESYNPLQKQFFFPNGEDHSGPPHLRTWGVYRGGFQGEPRKWNGTNKIFKRECPVIGLPSHLRGPLGLSTKEKTMAFQSPSILLNVKLQS